MKNKVAETKVEKDIPKVNKENKVNKKNKKLLKTGNKNVSEPVIKEAIKKEVENGTNKKAPKKKKAESTDNKEENLAEKNLSPEELSKLEKKKAKKAQKKVKKAQAKELKKTAKQDSKTGKPDENDKDKPKTDNKPKRDPGSAEATIFVGNLPTNSKRVQIERLFKEYGKVLSIRLRTASGKNLFKHKTRKEAGSLIAYVQLENVETANKALALNGVQFKANHLRVTLSNAKVTSALDGVSNFDSKRTVFVGNLKYSATEDKLREIFSSCGEIDYVRCLQDGEKGCKGVAYVCFKSPDAIGLALELNETVLDDRPIHVERYSINKLGAKAKRDAEAEQQKSKKKGAFKRLENKNKDKKEPVQKGKNKDAADDETPKKKKGEFRGVKVTAMKKKNKKKSNDQMKKMASKIAPKSNKEE